MPGKKIGDAFVAAHMETGQMTSEATTAARKAGEAAAGEFTKSIRIRSASGQTTLWPRLVPEATQAGRLAGTSAGQQFSQNVERYTRDANGRLRDSRGRFVTDAAAAGRTAGTSAGGWFSRHFTKDVDLKGFGSKVQSASASAASGLHRTFMASFRSIALAAGSILAGVEVFKFLKDSIAEQRESIRVGRMTEAVIRSTGGAAHISAQRVADMANSYSVLLGVDDELIQTGENLLLTFTNIRNEAGKGNSIFNAATKAILDMTAAMNAGAITQEGLKASTLQVGKALQDPIKGLTALQRVGVVFSKTQKEQITDFVKAGNVIAAQRVILAELTREFGGAAAAAADPAARMQVAWANLKEQVGGVIMPTMNNLVNFLTSKVLPAAQGFIDKFSEGFNRTADAASNFGEKAGAAEQAGEATRDVMDWLGQNLPRVAEGLANFGQRLRDIFADTGLTDAIKTLFEHFKPELIENTKNAFESFMNTINEHRGEISAIIIVVAAIFGQLLVTAPKVLYVLGGVITLISYVVDAIVWWVRIFVDALAMIATAAAKAFGWIPGIGPKIKDAAAAVNRAKDEINAALDKIHKDVPIRIKPYLSQQTLIVRVAISSAAAAMIGAAGGSIIGSRAMGGPAGPGIFRVGELGPELIFMTAPGMVVPARQSARLVRGLAGGTGFDRTNAGRALSALLATPSGSLVERLSAFGTRAGQVVDLTDRAAAKLAQALAGLSVVMDGRVVGQVQARSAGLLARGG